MPTRNTFLVVEGPHDAESIARLLKHVGFSQKTKLSDIPEDFRKLIPKDYPAKDEEGKEALLTDPHPVPRYYQNTDRWVFILIGGGSSSAATLAKALRASRLAGIGVDGIGVILDQDLESSPVVARDRFTTEFAKEQDLLPMPLNFAIPPGNVVQGSPRLGLFVLPDNGTIGALEDILLECAEVNYPALKSLARNFRDEALSKGALSGADLEIYGRSGGDKDVSMRKKAWVSAMGAILVPAAAIQNSIRMNRWLAGPALELGPVKVLRKFLDDLIA